MADTVGDEVSWVPNLAERTKCVIDAYGLGGYAKDYLHLLGAAKLLRDGNAPEALFGIAAISYAWMPTILKHWPTAQELQVLADWARRVEDTKAAAQALLLEPPPDLHVVNRSLVGTSKFLHFLRPDLFPIWDSVVASHWGLSRAKYELAKNYIQYIALVSDIASRPCCAAIRNIVYPGAPDVSDIRCVEYALFISSPKWVKKQQELLSLRKGKDA